ncbi:phosphatase PAP2 family protein [Hoeflea sp.]|uniref:phosphatase PAP2 family protein n=1 Tax=Hoeflea sp. TaxID=1940281 RepID=UPI00198E4723|nr:phosphatase PAP2 family protein [Hoeflea sp.]MBC7282002.1 phosphatase PAP2 family protein [Hoeflea sp.]
MTVQTLYLRSENPLLSGVLARLTADGWFYWAVLFYTIMGFAFLIAVGDAGGASHASYVLPAIKGFLLMMPLAALSFDVIRVIVRFDQRRRLAFRRTFSAGRLAALGSGMMMMAGIAVFQGTFTSIKTSLPLIFGGFPYDRLQADIDAWLHFGADPWRTLHAVAGNDAVRLIAEINYGEVWFTVCFGALFFVATSPAADAVRKRYLIMFMIVWIVVGNLLAGTFLSAGPAFYGNVTGDHARFAGLLAFLAQSPLDASVMLSQRYLWLLHENNIQGLGGGISAFPSVHVALVTMNALFVIERSRPWGIAAFAYVGFVLFSSVYLGWHYAIDGYVSIAVVTAAHFGLRRFMTGFRPAVPAYSSGR